MTYSAARCCICSKQRRTVPLMPPGCWLAHAAVLLSREIWRRCTGSPSGYSRGRPLGRLGGWFVLIVLFYTHLWPTRHILLHGLVIDPLNGLQSRQEGRR